MCTSLNFNAFDRDECLETGSSRKDSAAEPSLPKSLANLVCLIGSPALWKSDKCPYILLMK